MAASENSDLLKELLTALSAKKLETQLLSDIIRALQRSDLDAVSRLHCDRLAVLMRGIPKGGIPAQKARQKLMTTFSLIRADGSPIAIRSDCRPD